jgi:WD40 repeat protein
MSADANYIAVGGWYAWRTDGFVQVFNKDGQELWRVYFESFPYDVTVSDSGDFISVTLYNGTTYLFDHSGNMLWNNNYGLFRITMSSMGEYIFGIDRSSIFVLNTKGELLAAHYVGGTLYALSASGNGKYLAVGSESGLYLFEIRLTLPATTDIKPDTLNLKSKGEKITCYIELPEGYDVAKIDVSSIRLNGTVLAWANPTEVGDYNYNGIPDLMIKFDRAEVQKLFENQPIPGIYRIEITGEISGTPFEGIDTIVVIS